MKSRQRREGVKPRLFIKNKNYFTPAGVVEWQTHHLEGVALTRRGGSSPPSRTQKEGISLPFLLSFFCRRTILLRAARSADRSLAEGKKGVSAEADFIRQKPVSTSPLPEDSFGAAHKRKAKAFLFYFNSD